GVAWSTPVSRQSSWRCTATRPPRLGGKPDDQDSCHAPHQLALASTRHAPGQRRHRRHGRGRPDSRAALGAPVLLLCWYLQRRSPTAVGWAWGRWRASAVGGGYPAGGLGLLGLIAWLSGAATRAAIDWANTVVNLQNGLVLFLLANGLGALVS